MVNCRCRGLNASPCSWARDQQLQGRRARAPAEPAPLPPPHPCPPSRARRARRAPSLSLSLSLCPLGRRGRGAAARAAGRRRRGRGRRRRGRTAGRFRAGRVGHEPAVLGRAAAVLLQPDSPRAAPVAGMIVAIMSPPCLVARTYQRHGIGAPPTRWRRGMPEAAAAPRLQPHGIDAPARQQLPRRPLASIAPAPGAHPRRAAGRTIARAPPARRAAAGVPPRLARARRRRWAGRPAGLCNVWSCIRQNGLQTASSLGLAGNRLSPRTWAAARSCGGGVAECGLPAAGMVQPREWFKRRNAGWAAACRGCASYPEPRDSARMGAAAIIKPGAVHGAYRLGVCAAEASLQCCRPGRGPRVTCSLRQLEAHVCGETPHGPACALARM